MHRYRTPFLCGVAFLWLCAGVPLNALAQVDKTDTAAVGADTAAAAADSVAADTTAVVQSDTATQTAPTDSIWYTPGLAPVHLQPRYVPATDVSRLRKEDDFWYVSVGPDKPKPPTPPDPHLGWWARFFQRLGEFLSQDWVAFLLWSLLAGLMVAAIVYIIQSGNGEQWFRRRRSLKTMEVGPDAPGPEDPALALQKALDAGDFGEAERCLYLGALIHLGDKGLIRPTPEKTNREYLRELRGNPLYDDFTRLLRHYEYTFYGGFAPGPTAFQAIREQYAQFQTRLDAL